MRPVIERVRPKASRIERCLRNAFSLALSYRNFPTSVYERKRDRDEEEREREIDPISSSLSSLAIHLSLNVDLLSLCTESISQSGFE